MIYNKIEVFLIIRIQRIGKDNNNKYKEEINKSENKYTDENKEKE